MDTTATLTRALAADIVATARQYPAIREVRTFGDLHAIYDANESVIAAFDAAGLDILDDDPDFERSNAATEAVDEVLRLGGFAALRDLGY